MNKFLEDFIKVFTVPSGSGRAIKITTSGGIDDINQILTVTDPLGGRKIKVEFSNEFVKTITAGRNIQVDDTDPENVIISTSAEDIIVVANFSALPDPTTVSDNPFYWVSNSQGTSWLPGNLGGTYYPKGLYYSNGTSWEYIETPYQATLSEVIIGTNTDKFVTPSTLSGWWSNIKTLSQTISEFWEFKGIDFTNQTSTPTYKDGRLYYGNDKTLVFKNDISDFSHNLGYEHVVRVVNKTGVQILEGKAVYITGSFDPGGGRDELPTIALAKADNISTVISLGVTTTTMDNDEEGIVTMIGLVHDLDTSAFSANDRVHVSETVAGGFQTAEPLLNSEIGIVVKSHATEGILFVYNRPLSMTKKSSFFTADYDANFLTYRVKSVVTNGTQSFTFSIPSDFVSLVSIVLEGFVSAGAAGASKNIDLSSTYGKSGISETFTSETDTTILYDLTGYTNKIVSLDVSSVFTSLSDKDECGLQIVHNSIGGTINYLGVRLEYVGYN